MTRSEFEVAVACYVCHRDFGEATHTTPPRRRNKSFSPAIRLGDQLETLWDITYERTYHASARAGVVLNQRRLLLMLRLLDPECADLREECGFPRDLPEF